MSASARAMSTPPAAPLRRFQSRPFPAMMVDRGSKIFQLTTCRSGASSVERIIAARSPVDIAEHLVSKKACKRCNARYRFLGPCVATGKILGVNVQHVCDGDGRWMTRPGAGREAHVLFGEVGLECSLSAFKVCSSAASAPLVFSVSDDPRGAFDASGGKASLRFEPEARTFPRLRHFCFMTSIAASEVNSLPAISQTSSLPASRSRRKLAALMPPPGKPIRAASARRRNVSNATSSISIVGARVIMSIGGFCGELIVCHLGPFRVIFPMMSKWHH